MSYMGFGSIRNVLEIVPHPDPDPELEPEPEPVHDDDPLKLVINNVVSAFNVGCKLDLHHICLYGFNVMYRQKHNMVVMRLRKPATTTCIWASGQVTMTGAISEDLAKIGARRHARCLQKLNSRVSFRNFRILNVLGTCSMPWPIKINLFAEVHRSDCSYEPELHPGVTYRIPKPKATLKIFSTGSVTVTAGSVDAAKRSIELVYPELLKFRNTPDNPNIKVPTPNMVANKVVAAAASSSCRSGAPSNILSNARRRAADHWTTKNAKQPKQPESFTSNWDFD